LGFSHETNATMVMSTNAKAAVAPTLAFIGFLVMIHLIKNSEHSRLAMARRFG